MSVLLAVLVSPAGPDAPSPGALHAAAGMGSGRPAARVATWRSDDGRVTLAVGRQDWECSAWLSGEPEVARRGAVSVIADATLYARAELAASLAAVGVRVGPDDSAAMLIASAYRAFGARALLDLNGDFAFVLWDAERRMLHLGRDFVGTRTLHYLVAGQQLFVASTLDGILALAGDDAPMLDLLGLAEAASGLVHPSGRTCWAGVEALPPGRVHAADATLRVQEVARWSPPPFLSDGGSDFTAAADALRDLLRTAVSERMAPDVTTVWMSGGYDSPSVFATARAVAADGSRGRVESVSVSYPVGDQGREDEIIERILAHHGTTNRWIDSAEMPLLGDVEQQAAKRGDPFVAMYDGFFRRASRETREIGGRVAFSGHGGDVLFDSSMIYFADLLAGGHVRTLLHEWRASREAMWTSASLLKETLAPLVPDSVARRTSALLGRRNERSHQPAPWLRAPLARQIAETGWMPLAPRRGETRASAVAGWSLTFPFFTKSQECAAAAARALGVEYRMPLLDPRVLAFAASRPRWERRTGVRSKSLLRAAMTGMLPDEVLLPRRFKTGLTRDYLLQSVREEFPRHVAAMARDSALADLGVIEPSILSRAVADSANDPDGWVAGQLYFTIQAEYWLRARVGASRVGAVQGVARTTRQSAAHLSVPVIDAGRVPVTAADPFRPRQGRPRPA